jgi:uncharacterized iron-regulated protein
VSWLIVTIALILAGCVQQPDTGFKPWISTQLLDHPLTGRIWLPNAERFATADEVMLSMSRAKYVLLGERHDNPDHHRIQAWATAGITKHGRRPALVMEMFRTNQQKKIDAHLTAHPRDSLGLGKAVGWSRAGWAPWRQYEPIVRPIIAKGLPLIAGNLSRSKIRPLIKQGFGALKIKELRSLSLDRPFPKQMLKAMDQEITDAHCGYLKKARARPFTRIQLLRDALFARAMRRGEVQTDGAILITGAGHARFDRGVPRHLRRAGVPTREIFSLGILEVTKDSNKPGQYGAIYGARKLPFDAVWFTPRTSRPDPCERFKNYCRKK